MPNLEFFAKFGMNSFEYSSMMNSVVVLDDLFRN